MSLTSERHPQALAFGLVLASLLGALGWFWWSATQRSDIAFLPRRAGAEWIAYPCPPEIMNQSRIEMQTVFKRSFQMDEVPAISVLRVAALHTYSLSINGASVAEPTARGRNWKYPDTFELTGKLRPGENQLEVSVVNTNGPAALWLQLQAGAFTLASDPNWDASYAGSAWRKARLAATRRVALKGNPTYGGERPWASFKTSWPMLLLFAALGGALCWFLSRMSPTTNPKVPNKRLFIEHLPILFLTALWVALFLNNLGALGPKVGYDISGHISYVRYIQEHHSLPQASEGWELHQPPLYYLLCAALLNLLSLSAADWSGITALRILGLGIGVAHFALVWACLRLLFPNNAPPLDAPPSTLHPPPSRLFAPRSAFLTPQTFGLLLAAFLPPVLYLAQFVTNEAMAAMLVTACVYLTLRTLKEEQPSWKLHALLGLSLGAALLTKLTAVLLLPLVFIALSWQNLRLGKSQKYSRWSRCALRMALIFGVCAVVSGWHYTRGWQHAQAWLRDNSQLLGVWDPRTGFPWWQDEGYRTRAFDLHFGDALFHPWYSSMRSFADGIYSTLWGDGLFSGATELRYRPPWNYELMVAGYWLALLPTLIILAGAVIAVIKFIRQPSPEWFLLLGLGFVMASALVFFSLMVPYYCTVKAIYGLSFLTPVCAFAAVAWQTVLQRVGASSAASPARATSRNFAWPRAATVISILFCVWAVDSYATFWIRRSSVPTLLGRVRHLVEERQYADAVSMLKARLDLGTGSATQGPSDKTDRAAMQCFLASLLLASGNSAEAQQQSEAVLRDDPDIGDAHLTLEQALARQGHTEEAMTNARRAIELIPGYGLPYTDLSELLLKQSRYEEAVGVAREGLVIAPSNPQLRLFLGCGLLLTDQDAAAQTQLRLAFSFRPEWPEGHAFLGSLLQARRRYDVAAEAYAQALKSNPDDAECQAALGSVLLMKGKPDEAAAHLSEALRLQPGNSQVRYQLAGALQTQHKTSEAINEYLEILRTDPQFSEALNNLAWIRAAHAKPEFRNGAEAVRLGEQACQLTQYKEPMFIGTLAAAYAEAGRFQEAAAMATKAKDLALAAGQTDLAKKNADLLELYKAGKPYHEKEE